MKCTFCSYGLHGLDDFVVYHEFMVYDDVMLYDDFVVSDNFMGYADVMAWNMMTS